MRRCFKKFTRTINFIGTGYKNIGNFQIGPWYNWVTANSWEGFGFALTLVPINILIKTNVAWYLAYGFGDKKLKGKGGVILST